MSDTGFFTEEPVPVSEMLCSVQNVKTVGKIHNSSNATYLHKFVLIVVSITEQILYPQLCQRDLGTSGNLTWPSVVG